MRISAKRECMEVRSKMKSNTFKEYIAPVVVLVVICLVVTGLLAFANSITAPIIEANSIAAANEARFELLPDADDFTLFDGDLVVLEDKKVYVSDCYVANNGTGMVVTVRTKSFGGILTEMVGIDANGAIRWVKVTDHADTPGLGTKEHYAEYVKQYHGLTEYKYYTVKTDTNINHVSCSP